MHYAYHIIYIIYYQTMSNPLVPDFYAKLNNGKEESDFSSYPILTKKPEHLNGSHAKILIRCLRIGSPAKIRKNHPCSTYMRKK